MIWRQSQDAAPRTRVVLPDASVVPSRNVPAANAASRAKTITLRSTKPHSIDRKVGNQSLGVSRTLRLLEGMHRVFNRGCNPLSLRLVHSDRPLPAAHQKDNDAEQNDAHSAADLTLHRRTISGPKRGHKQRWANGNAIGRRRCGDTKAISKGRERATRVSLVSGAW